MGSVRLAKLANVMGYVDGGVLGRWQGRNWLHSLSIGMNGPEGFEPLSPEDRSPVRARGRRPTQPSPMAPSQPKYPE